ncbi:MAG TPA: helix-turn-helix transcriptional regulator [Oscillatoriales cyanobacterium M59_W2019_021]|nr:helix-turn-helix transcriptional regulator [Oscillatoriales cyanobacterium M59_W2019_021]
MGKAGKALRQVLESYGISQNQLAVQIGAKPSVVFRWFHQKTDPSGNTIDEIAKALQQIDPSAATEFVRLYLGEYLDELEE